MIGGGGKLPSASAALSGIPAGVQGRGPWAGRRQLFVRFAAEAETATIYTADALRGEISRLAARSPYHSVAITGRDALAEIDFLAAAFEKDAPLPVMLDHDGQRPEALARLAGALALVQVTMDGTESAAAVERACQSLACAADKRVTHALAISPAERASDAALLRIVEQARQASTATSVVVHPSPESAAARDRRWVLWIERAMAVHSDVRLLLPLPREIAANSQS